MRSSINLRRLIYLGTMICIVSCKTETKTGITIGDSNAAAAKPLADTGANANAYAEAYYKLTANYKDASLPDTVKNSKAFYFSNPKAYDSFMVIVPPGLIASTKSMFIIKTAAGNIIYSETFNTKYFARQAFEPDTIPPDAEGYDYDKYRLAFAQSITKEQVQRSVINKIGKFYDEDIFSDRSVLKNNDAEAISDKELFKEVVADKNAKIIWLPCFNCDEGVSFIAYSKKRQKAFVFLSSD